MWLVVGLGNPGKEYEHNRHNIGFLALDFIVRSLGAGQLGVSPWARKYGGEICEYRSENPEARCYFLKPHTFMNLSGQSVAAAAGFYKIPPENVIVLCDDLDLLPGKLRVKQGGGHGGHNGIRSIDSHIGQDYWRVRIGVGHPGDKEQVTNHVLGNFSKADWLVQEKMLDAITRNFPLLLERNAALFMNKIALEVKHEA